MVRRSPRSTTDTMATMVTADSALDSSRMAMEVPTAVPASCGFSIKSFKRSELNPKVAKDVKKAVYSAA